MKLKFIRACNVMAMSIALSVPVLSAAPYTNVYIAEMKVETIKQIDPNSGNNETKYKVDGIDIDITNKDLVKAKNWNLNAEQWAQYKYAMEYTPRSIWSPDLDPPIVLGLLAKTEREKLHYARIMNAIELDRRARELELQKYGIVDIKERMGTTTLARQTELTAIEKRLGRNKTGIKSIFVNTNINACDRACTKFLLKTISSTPSSQNIVIYYNEGSDSDVYALFRKAGIRETDLNEKDIVLTKSKSKFEKYVHSTKELPFYIKITDKGETRIGIQRDRESKS